MENMKPDINRDIPLLDRDREQERALRVSEALKGWDRQTEQDRRFKALLSGGV